MHNITVGMEFDILKENNNIANENYEMLKEHNIVSVDFMGSIGAGKTALIIKLAEKLREKIQETHLSVLRFWRQFFPPLSLKDGPSQ